mmetsp:Transcript_23701/g.23959  ORF Transcript_23701/g.23959 Transcript_23701/m.23959 type:complete len:146 (+) Transcript_23701:246-683(+)
MTETHIHVDTNIIEEEYYDKSTTTVPTIKSTTITTKSNSNNNNNEINSNMNYSTRMSLSVTVLLMASQYSHYNFNQSFVAIVSSLTANKLLITSCHADRVESTWKQKAATTTIVLVMVRRGPSSSSRESIITDSHQNMGSIHHYF